MRDFILDIGTTIETNEGTQLVCDTYLETDKILFYEYKYNDFTCDYDILIDDYRVLSRDEIKNILHKSTGKNYDSIILK